MISNCNIRTRLLIGASLSAMLLTGVAEAQDRSGGGWGRGARGAGADPTAAAARAAQDEAIRQTQTNSATQRALEAFRRAAQTRTQMQDAQVQARIAAQQAINNIPNGIGPGGLQAAPEIEIDQSLWVGANGPVQSAGKDGRTNVTIDQTESKAILTWDSFNVGRETDLTFNQQSADWVVLNRVRDASPSQIHGSVNAKGTVLILNQNGILFGGASTINVKNLAAAAANITDSQFLNSGIYSSLSDGSYLPSFTNAGGKITVEAGAQIKTHSPDSVTAGGGYVLLLGTEVTNAGSIATPRGQTLLAAGDDFLIRKGYGTEENQSSTTRGNEARATIGADSDSGTVTNTGVIEAVQGDVTLTGRKISQDGVALATTSVNQRGTIHLLNSADDAEGSVELGPDSLTIVLPELESEDTALDGQRDSLISQSRKMDALRAGLSNGQFDNLGSLSDRLDQSRIEIVSGGKVLFSGGSQTNAQGGQVVVQADNGRITVENDARIDVSGVMGIAMDMASNSIRVNVQGNELRDSAPNRENGNIKSQDIWVDVRDLVMLPDGTGGYDGDRWYTKGGLLELSGALANRPRTIGEWASIGGTITLAAKEIVAQKGAIFDISGGSLDYQAGWVRSTRVLGADGKLYDLATAPAYMKMLAWGDAYVRSHERWGEQYTQVWSHPLGGARSSRRWSEGYSVGRDAGRLILGAPTILFDGEILGDVVTGQRQIEARPDDVRDGFKLGQAQVAQAGGLTIGRQGSFGQAGALDSRAEIGSFVSGTGQLSWDEAISDNFQNSVLLDSGRLSSFGLGRLDIAVSGPFAITSDLAVADGGAIKLAASTIDVSATIRARGGSVDISNVARVSSSDPSTDSGIVLAGEETGIFRLHDGATMDLRGIWTNQNDGRYSLAHIDGGTLSVRMVRGSVRLDAGSLVDVTSGATLSQSAELVGGRGGDVTLIAGALDGANPGAVVSTAPNPSGTRLTMDGEIRAWGVEGGGKLTLHSPVTTIFGSNDRLAGLATGVLPAGTQAPTALILSEDAVLKGDVVLPNGITLSVKTTPLDIPLPAGTVPTTFAIVTTGDWAVTDGLAVNTDRGSFYGGSTVPAGATVYEIINARGDQTLGGLVLPSSVFPEGLPLVNAIPVTVAPGGRLGFDYSYRAGDTVPAGMVFGQPVLFEPAATLSSDLLNRGFSNYAISSRAGLQLADGTSLRVEVPVLRLTEDSRGWKTGADPLDALQLWTPPVFQADIASGTMVQRAGADLSLRAADVRLGLGSRIEVDPGRKIRIAAQGAQLLEGDLVARGGTITAVTEAVLDPQFSDDVIRYRDPLVPVKAEPIAIPAGASIWIGPKAQLDVSGVSAAGTSLSGRRFGIAQNGGSIQLGVENYARVDRRDLVRASNVPILIQDGAVLAASGAALTVDLSLGDVAAGAFRPVELAGDGGRIEIGTQRSIFNNGTMIARAGGDGAAGGVLNIVLENDINYDHYGYKVLTIAQTRAAADFPAAAAPGIVGLDLPDGVARISAEEVVAGGFGALDLLSRDVFAFEGDIRLNLPQSLILRRGILSIAQPETPATVNLSAAYTHLDGWVPPNTGENERISGLRTNNSDRLLYTTSSVNAGRLAISADLIDISGQVMVGHDAGTFDIPGFADVTLTSRTDIRFTDGQLTTGSDTNLIAAQIYPTTMAKGVIRLGYNWRNPDPTLKTLTIRGNGTNPAVPFSAFGQMVLAADRIDQGGIIRAPLGGILFMGRDVPDVLWGTESTAITLRAGSITSTSATGLTMPYGGVSDGIEYRYNGGVVEFSDPLDVQVASPNGEIKPLGIIFGNSSVAAEAGSVIDLSGGGQLLGAGFVSGRGGSVDILRQALSSANPAYGTNGGDGIYAIVPTGSAAYAPIAPDVGAGDPRVGQTITLTRKTGNLPAGTYVLLPSIYALLPGAYRIELGTSSAVDSDNVAQHSGSFVSQGYLGSPVAGLRDALPTSFVLTPADAVRTLSRYDETSYAAFAATQANLFGAPKPRVELDAQTVQFNLLPTGTTFDFKGDIRLNGSDGGRSGGIFVTGGAIEVRRDDQAAATDMISLSQADVARLGSGTLVLGASYDLNQVFIDGAPAGWEVRLGHKFKPAPYDVVVREGVTITAGDVLLVGTNIALETGATINGSGTIGGALSDTAYPIRSADFSVLTVGGGRIDVGLSTTVAPDGGIRIDDGARLRADGSIGFATSGDTVLGDAELKARYLTFANDIINIGDETVLADGSPFSGKGSGAKLSVQKLEALASGVDGLEKLVLNASGALSFAGDFTLDLKSRDNTPMSLVLITPAIYGWGATTDTAQISVDTLVWSGQSLGSGFNRTGSGVSLPVMTSAPPAPLVPGGAGTGSGRLVLEADSIMFGYDADTPQQDQATLDRLALGFDRVELAARDRLTANSRGTLSVYRGGVDAATYSGGDLSITTSLLTAESGAFLSLRAGGDLSVGMAGDTPAASMAALDTIGAEIRLSATNVTIDTPVVLTSGRLAVNAQNNVTLGSQAALDVTGQKVRFFDKTVATPGGEIVLLSHAGNISQSAGSIMNVSASDADAGTIRLLAPQGLVDLLGTIRGSGGSDKTGGKFSLSAERLRDFAAFNRNLSDGGFFGERNFVLGSGDLTIGDEVRASQVDIAVNGGSLKVDGRIDASGRRVGTIRLAARDDLTLSSRAILDVHGTELQRDGRREAIDATNRGHIELSSTDGGVALSEGAVMDLRSADNIARGQVEINVSRLGADDIAFQAAEGAVVRGAASVAVNAMRTYRPESGEINQAYMDTIHRDSVAFIDAALGNERVSARLGGLAPLGAALHLRPGVEIAGGDLTVTGDIDLSGYRYGPDADPARRGSGETGLLLLRATGDLAIRGSLTDGFAPPPSTPDDSNWGQLLSSGVLTDDLIMPVAGVILAGGSTTISLADISVLNFDITTGDFTQLAPGIAPQPITVLNGSFSEGAVINADILTETGDILYPAGYRFETFQTLPAGSVLTKGFDTSLGFIYAARTTWTAGTPLDVLPDYGVILDIDTVLPSGALIPKGSNVAYASSPFIPSRPINADGTQGRLWAIAPMLDPGMSSWAMRLVGGAELAAADTRAVSLSGRGSVIMSDLHYAGSPLVQAPSVVRTGTGFLEIMAGGDYRQDTLFGVYTAGTQSAETEAWSVARAPNALDPTSVLGYNGYAYEATFNAQRMFFAENGGDLRVSVRGDATQKIDMIPESIYSSTLNPRVNSSAWLWRQGGEALGQRAAWGINFGQYSPYGSSVYDEGIAVAGFTGIGTLGGGNLSLSIEGDAGLLAADATNAMNGLHLAVASTGRVDADGSLSQTGGGDLTLRIGGRFNARFDPTDANQRAAGGSLTNLRGAIVASAGSFGLTHDAAYGLAVSQMDPRAPNYAEPGQRYGYTPIRIELGDATADVVSRGDLVVATGTNPGLSQSTTLYGMKTAAEKDGASGAAAAGFSLWTDRSAIRLLALGGDIRQSHVDLSGGGIGVDPGTIAFAATRGSISSDLLLAPATGGALGLLAWSGLYGRANMTSADTADVATPFDPIWYFSPSYDVSSWDVISNGNRTYKLIGDYFGFGTGTATNLHQRSDNNIDFYSVTGDIVLNSGSAGVVAIGEAGEFQNSYTVSQPVRMWAGRDIITDLILLNNDANDISIIRAGRDILNTEVEAYGPGVVEISAGRNIYLNAKNNGDHLPRFASRGPLIAGDERPGAQITLMAGVGGAGAPSYEALATLYLDPENRAEAGSSLANQPGKVAHSYEEELLTWLRRRFGFEGNAAGALPYFLALAPELQHIFLNQVYFQELRQSGREYNDAAGSRFGSYLRGRNAIDTLFPRLDANGNEIVRSGSIILLESAGVHTDFGGDITLLTPGGGVTLGTSTFIPPASTGLLTQGNGNIDVFAQQSVLLGLSRVFTTFGGDITMWSAQGDINAGRGAGGTVIYAPPKIVYDRYGNVALAPTAPSSGAGIATLNPVPEVAPGDIDLIAPLGTIDAGEAGIRISGNINLAALQVLNASNIKVQGEATGIPAAVSVNTGALTAASSTVSAVANQAAQLAERARPQVRTEIPSLVDVRFLGFGENP